MLAGSYLEEEAVSTLPPEDFGARLILAVLLVDLQLFFLTIKGQKIPFLLNKLHKLTRKLFIKLSQPTRKLNPASTPAKRPAVDFALMRLKQ